MTTTANIDRAQRFAERIGDTLRAGAGGALSGTWYMVRGDMLARVTVWDAPEVDEAQIDIYLIDHLDRDDHLDLDRIFSTLDHLDCVYGCLVGPIAGYEDHWRTEDPSS
jgi:hypothetical protein